MSCKSALYGANTSIQTIPSNGLVNFGSVVRRFGCGCNLSGGNAEISGQGYYFIDTNVSIEVVGDATITLYKDGVAIPGATATIFGTSGQSIAVSIPAMVRQNCPCTSTITMSVSADATITNATITIEKA